MERQKPEDVIGAARPFTGQEYLESLKDGREVYIYGERVKDVTVHPAFRNAARSVARLNDALHDEKQKAVLTCPTDTGSGSFTHKFFRVARSREDLVGQRDAIAHWARLSYGWMGRSPDYKASLMNALGANAPFYERFADNAQLVRALPEPRSVYVPRHRQSAGRPHESGRSGQGRVHQHPEGDGRRHCGLGRQGGGDVGRNHALQFHGAERCHPDRRHRPGRDVHRAIEKIKVFYPRSGFLAGYQFQGCTRLAVKRDFLVGVIAKALRAAGSDEFRGNQAMLGEVIAWRNLFWGLSDAMALNPMPWVGDAVLPNSQSGSAYRVFAGDAFARVKEIVEKIVASSLIYLPSSVKDMKKPATEPYLKRLVRGSHGIDFRERIKIMKLLWDAIGTEFGGRHELYEYNYAGNHEDIRIHAMLNVKGSGAYDRMIALADQCMADYDEDGWTGDSWVNPDDVAYKPGSPA